MPRLKNSEIKAHREQMLKDQGGICPLCKTKILKHEAVLDHCHSTGRVRGVLHNSCNRAEGEIGKAIYRSRAGNQRQDLIDFITSLGVYWEQDYSDNILHPKHLLPEEKEIKRLRKIMKALKTDEAKEKRKSQIKYLQKRAKEILEAM